MMRRVYVEHGVVFLGRRDYRAFGFQIEMR